MEKLQKLFDRITLLLSTYSPQELYIGVCFLFLILFLLVVFMGFLYRIIFKTKIQFNLLVIPSLISSLPLFFTLLTIFSGKVNLFLCLWALFLAFGMNIIFMRLISDSESGSDSVLVFRGFRDNFEKIKNNKGFYVGFLCLIIFYIFSIDHNFLPAQYDVTTYSFIGDLLFRKGTYPTVSFAQQYQITIFPPPGYFIFDYLAKVFWNSPRSLLLISILFFTSVIIVFLKLSFNIFKNNKIGLFVLIAILSRGIFWNYWEFNLLRALSLVCSLMFLICYLEFYRSANFKVSLSYLMFAQVFLASAFVSHPENTAYILGGIFLVTAFMFIYNAIKKNKDLLYKNIAFGLSMVFSLSVFAFWYFLVLKRYSDTSYITEEVLAPVPSFLNLLYHFNGVLPILISFTGIFLMLRRDSTRQLGKIFAFLFIFNFLLAYFQYFLHFLFPSIFSLVRQEYNDMHGTSLFVKTFLINPFGLIVKITSFWWLAILISAWFYYFAWQKLRSLKIRMLVALVFFPFLFLDLIYLYYNKPIIKESEYRFLLSLKKELPLDAIIIAPPGYHFSAWTGPVLQRDSISYRSAKHVKNSISKDIEQMITEAYSSGNFDKWTNKLMVDKVIILFNEDYSVLAEKLLATPDFKLVLKQNSVYALSLRRI